MLKTAAYFYEIERSDNPGKAPTCTTGCSTDKVNRTTLWNGNIDLMYPSDYMFAISGGNQTSFEICFSNSVDLCANVFIDCRDNDWLSKKVISQWLLTSFDHSVNSVDSFFIHSSGNSFNNTDSFPHSMFSTLFFKSNVSIVSGIGEEKNSYEIEWKE